MLIIHCDSFWCVRLGHRGSVQKVIKTQTKDTFTYDSVNCKGIRCFPAEDKENTPVNDVTLSVYMCCCKSGTFGFVNLRNAKI